MLCDLGNRFFFRLRFFNERVAIGLDVDVGEEWKDESFQCRLEELLRLTLVR